ncbi:MAG: hypothetical protein HEQ16_04630 [Bosea sp.]|nr:hypothetical protein [Bosea sp. (in: a-proteobacteria)]
MAAHRRGDQVLKPYALIAEGEAHRALEPALARLMAVRADLADSTTGASDAALSGMLIAEEQAHLDVAVAPVDCLRCLRRKFSAVSMALSEEELDPKRLSILLAALGADIDHLIRKH